MRIEDVKGIIEEFNELDVTKIDAVDQLKLMAAYIELAKTIKPIVRKYSGKGRISDALLEELRRVYREEHN